MKTTTIASLTLIAALIMSGLIFNSCSKEEMGGQTTLNQNERAKEVFAKIQDFNTKVNYIRENSGYKSGEDMSLDSALWNLNAGLNLVNSNPDIYYKGFYVDSAFTNLSVVGGTVNLDDLAIAYFNIEDSASLIENAAPYDEKDIKFTFIDLKSNTDSTVLLKSTTIVGEKGIDPDGPPYAEGDNWRYGGEYGMCDNPNTEGDAAINLRDTINARRYLHVDDEGQTVFYTNPVVLHNILANYSSDFLNPNDQTANDNIRDYLMFYVHEDNLTGNQNLWDDFSCIEYDDMNYYYYGTSNVIYNKIPTMNQDWPQAYGKTFFHLDSLQGTDKKDILGKVYYIHIIKEIRYAQRWVMGH